MRACHRLLWDSVTDLGHRHGTPLKGSEEDWWAGGESLHRYLAEHAAEWWVAESADAGLAGYARSIERGGLFELTELFVRPGEQSRGIGRELIERAFPQGRGDVRSIIATTDVRATSRYFAAGTVARFPYFTLAGRPRPDAHLGDLVAEPIGADDSSAMSPVTDIERTVLDFPRGTDELRWLAADREGLLFLRGGDPVGFGFISKHGAGPVAALDPEDLPLILGHLEARATAVGVEELEFEVPGINAAAMRHLLGRGFHIDPWFNLLMSDRPFGQFDRYIGYSPPIFL